MKNIKLLWIIRYTLCLGIVLWASCENKQKALTPEQETAMYYLYNKPLISDTFARMLWKVPVDFRGIDIEKQLLYFIFKSKYNRSNIIQKIAVDTNDIEFAPCTTGMCEFGGLKGDITGYTAFRMPVANMKVESNIKLETKMTTLKKYFSVKDIMALRDSQKYLGMHYKIALPADKFTVPYAANIGAFITKKDKDPVLQIMAAEIQKATSSNEIVAQKLLDIVTQEIKYSFADHWYGKEITKRAHEVMLSGLGDCSAKTTLYASLLEQCNIPYCLLYFENHVNVGVAGNFATLTPYTFKIKGTTYHMAETTSENFVIGKTRLKDNELFKNLFFYQIPSLSETIYDFKSHKPLDWYELEME